MTTKKEELLAQMEDAKNLISSIEEDVKVFAEKDVKTASTRARKGAMELAKLMKLMRATISEIRNEK